MLPRIAEFLTRHAQELNEIWTARELAAAEEKAHARDLYLATRWALKEATLKALGTGWGAGAQWTDIETVGRLFAPRIFLHAAARQIAAERGATGAIGSTARAGPCVLAIAKLIFSPGVAGGY